METYLKLKPSGCKDCYKCIRNCPVKAIRFSENQAQIIEDECILCLSLIHISEPTRRS